MSEFVQSIYSTGQYNTFNINQILEQISQQQNIKKEVILEALKRIGEAQEMLGDGEDLEVI